MSEQKRDPNLDHPAVVAYRDKFKLCPNRGLRKDIAVTVTDHVLWLKILNSWRYQTEGGKVRGKNPLAVKAMLDTYDAAIIKRNDEIQQSGSRVCRTESVPKRGPGRVSKSEVPTLLARTRF